MGAVTAGVPDAGPRPWLRFYPPGVPQRLEVPPLMLHEWIGSVIRDHPRRTALIFYGRRWSYQRLGLESARFAASLARDGVQPGNRVALYLPNCPAFPIAFLGALRAGAIAVPVSPLLQRDDLSAVLGDSSPRALVTLEILHPNLAALSPKTTVPIEYVVRLPEQYPVFLRPFVNLALRRQGRSTSLPKGPGIHRWARAVRLPGVPLDPHGDPATTVAVYQYTGGTTGGTKAAMLSHRNLVANALQVRLWNVTRVPGAETVLASIPLFHVYGLTVGLLSGLSEGAAVVLQTRPEPAELLRLIGRYRPTQFPGVPALYRALLRQPRISRYDLRSIRFCLSGSAPLPAELMREFEARTGVRLIEGYGLSEASPVTHANPAVGERRAGSIGVPVPGTDQRIVDLETGERTLGAGELGELCVRGPQLMLGYFGKPEESAAAIRDGWLRTGDVARIDPDGWAYLVDRKKDMINVGGWKVYPREVEEVLLEHPAVAEAAAIGVPDPDRGEAVQAYVVLAPGRSASEPELIGFVRERLAHYKAPRAIRFRTELPRSGVQKVLRRVLRDEALAPAAQAPRT